MTPPTRLLAAGLLLWAAGNASAQSVTWVLPEPGAVVWRGIASEESAGAQGLHMLYPAPNAGGLLAAILTHVALVQGGRASERQARQAEADRVLQSHAATIAELTPRALLELALPRLGSGPHRVAATPADIDAEGMVVEFQPTFALAGDQRVLVLDNAVRVRERAGAAPRFEQVVRVVSTPRESDDPQAGWTAEQGQALRVESAQMLAHSLQLALSPPPAQAEGTARTQRYRFGAGEKMERGQAVASGCGRVVLRTLRDWLMSVPVARPDGAPACTGDYSVAPP